MPDLARGVYSVTRTKRRRFLWCAWWKGEPTASPFRPPDAWGGGARSEEDAERAAAAAAGAPLERIEGRWAGAWVRVRAGLPPFVGRGERVGSTRADAVGAPRAAGADPYKLLGIPPDATLAVVKEAFRKKALEHHPDHGGSPAAFIALKRAYDRIVQRRARPRPRSPGSRSRKEV
jgi:hypothetical protein